MPPKARNKSKRAIWLLATLRDGKQREFNVDCVAAGAKKEYIVVWKAGDTDAPPQTILDLGLPNHLLQRSHFPLEKNWGLRGEGRTP